MDARHFFRTALNERKTTDSFFNEIAPTQPPTDPNDPAALKAKQPPAAGGTPPPAPAQPPVAKAQTTPNTAPKPTAAPTAPTPGPATPPQTNTPSQKAVSSMTVTGKADTDLANGVSLPAGSQAVIAPGDLSGNVNVTIDGKTYTVPDANLKQLIRGGSLSVNSSESLVENFLDKAKASGV